MGRFVVSVAQHGVDLVLRQPDTAVQCIVLRRCRILASFHLISQRNKASSVDCRANLLAILTAGVRLNT